MTPILASAIFPLTMNENEKEKKSQQQSLLPIVKTGNIFYFGEDQYPERPNFDLYKRLGQEPVDTEIKKGNPGLFLFLDRFGNAWVKGGLFICRYLYREDSERIPKVSQKTIQECASDLRKALEGNSEEEFLNLRKYRPENPNLMGTLASLLINLKKRVPLGEIEEKDLRDVKLATLLTYEILRRQVASEN